jgi:glycosyltransferase involved in cell wall biosynthesis
MIIANDKDYIIELSGSSNSNKTRFIPNPVDINLYYDVSNVNIKFKYKRIIIIRNIREDRGILEGIKAFNLLKKEWIFKDWKLDIYGSFNNSDDYYINCIRESEINSDINFNGPIKSHDVVNELRKSTIALVPSQDKEGTSLSALEAMASSVLCISTPIGGLLDIPTYKSSSRSPQDIAIAIKAACIDYEKILLRQIKETRENFNLEKWNEKICDCLRQVENE